MSRVVALASAIWLRGALCFFESSAVRRTVNVGEMGNHASYERARHTRNWSIAFRDVHRTCVLPIRGLDGDDECVFSTKFDPIAFL